MLAHLKTSLSWILHKFFVCKPALTTHRPFGRARFARGLDKATYNHNYAHNLNNELLHNTTFFINIISELFHDTRVDLISFMNTGNCLEI